jgi:hypothetical protein
MRNPFDRPVFRQAFRLAVIVACATFVPRCISGHPAAAYFHDEEHAQVALATEVQSFVESGVAATAFHTGSPRFDGEWAFVTFTMAAMGLGQVALHHPAKLAGYVPTIEKCAEELTSTETNSFGTSAWGISGYDGLSDGTGHAYLGYANLALSMMRLHKRKTKFARLHDYLTEALAKRLSEAPHALFETYPGEAYPADISIVAASIALHDCATGKKTRSFWPAWQKAFSEWIDPHSGLLIQNGDASSGKPLGSPRASGTALAAFALSFVDKELSAQLYRALSQSSTSFLGFGGIREYPSGFHAGGDIDSGPVVLGVSVSATGFTLASAKLHDDASLFTRLHRTTDLWGVPIHRTSGTRYMSGGPLGNAILLAMMTATWKWESHCKKPVDT